MNEVLYHYTTGSLFRRMLHKGAIEPDRSEANNLKEVPSITFSSHPTWEATRFRVGKLPDGQLVMMSKKLLQKFDGGVYRIVVPASIAILDWKGMKNSLGMSQACIKGIYDFAIMVGARTRHWYATTERVSEDCWITVEKLNDADEWVELTAEEIPEPLDDSSPMVILPEEEAGLISVPIV